MQRTSRYHTTEILGEGGNAKVYRAWDSLQKREVALKVLKSSSAADETSRLRFQREADILAGLDHPCLPKVYDHGLNESGQPYMAMQIMLGHRAKELSYREKLEMAIKLCDCLDYVHGQGVLHRDIKPENIVHGTGARVWLVDWGLAGPMEQCQARLTRENTYLGTLRYSSPEQLQGRHFKANDVFSLGCSLYEIFTGQAAHQGEQIHDIVFAVLNTEPRPAHQIAQLPGTISRLLSHMMKKDFSTRLKDLLEVKATLEAAREESLPSPRASWMERLSRIAS